MKEFPEQCPIKEMLKQVASILDLLHKAMEHCDKCVAGQEEKEKA